MNTCHGLRYGLPEHAVERICAVFRAYPAIRRVVLYGSRAKGSYRPGSDIDLCIEAEGLGIAELLEIENRIDDLLLPWKVDIALWQKIGNPELLDRIDRFGVAFYERE